MGLFTMSKNLPGVFYDVYNNKREGILSCSPDNQQHIQLFFQRGELIHVHGVKAEHTPEELLHELLAWGDFLLEWQPLAIRMAVANCNVTADTRQAFSNVLQVLTDIGNFAPPQQNQLPEGFFTPKTELVQEVKEPFSSQSLVQAGELPISQPKIEVNNNHSVETNLLLPPGVRQDQLEDLLAALPLKDQLESLIRTMFTGYVYYQPNSALSNLNSYGLILLYSGKISDVLYVDLSGNSRQVGQPALKNIANLIAQRTLPQIFRVEPRLLKAYRALVTGNTVQQEVKATKSSFSAALDAFKRSGRDGVILLYIDTLKLHYFFLLESGSQVGIFSPESKTGRLQPLSAPFALPSTDANAFLTVMVTSTKSKPSQMPIPSTNIVATLDAPQIDAILFKPVDWRETLERTFVPEIAGREKAKSIGNPNLAEISNPFEF